MTPAQSTNAGTPDSARGELPKKGDAMGLIVQNGIVYSIRDGKATRVDQTSIPNGRMMTPSGSLIAIPDGITGLRNSSSTGHQDSSSDNSHGDASGTATETSGSRATNPGSSTGAPDSNAH